MKVLFLSFCLLYSPLSWSKKFKDQKIGGTIQLPKKLMKEIVPGGVLYISVRPVGRRQGPPTAVVRIDNPTFPQAFVIGPKNRMLPGVPFVGPFNLVAKYTKTGNPMDRKNILRSRVGFQKGKGIEAGRRDLVLTLKK